MRIEGGILQRNGSFVVEVGPEEAVERVERSGRAGGPRGMKSSKPVWMVEDRILNALGGSRYTSVSHKSPTSPGTRCCET